MKVSRNYLCLFALLFAFNVGISSLQAQNTSDPRPSLLIRDTDGQQVGLHMNKLKVDVKVVGKIATTTLDMTFSNGTDRDLKAELVFPLGEGQTVSRFAMDVNGYLREGVVVEKQKGRQVFEKIVRRNIDPGLLEWTKGNNFKASVYPVPANGHKRIVVAYDQELQMTREGLVYLLPMNYPDVLEKFDLKVEVFQQKVAPELQENALTNLRFERWEENYVAELHETNYVAKKQLGFAVPPAKSNTHAFVEKGADGQQYFFVDLQPEIETRTKAAPKRVALIWDASASGATRDRARELTLLDAYFAQLGDVELQLITFSLAATRPRESAVRAGNWSAMRAVIEGLPYDGATQLGCLDFTGLNADEVLLFSDGISNIGKATVKVGKQAVYCISSGPSAEHSYLRSLAEQTGGTYIPLQTTTPAAALDLLSKQPYRFLRATSKGAALSATYPDHPTVVQGDFAYAGILQGEKATVTLEFGIGDKVLHRKSITVNVKQHMSESGLVQRLWAQKKLASLERNPTVNEAAIVALARKQKLVTRFTSLIVLESLEDYLEFDIMPPKDLEDGFLVERSRRAEEKKEAVDEHLEYVLGAWKARKKWWGTKFSWEKPKPVKKPKKSTSGNYESSAGDDWGEDEEEEQPIIISENAAERNLDLTEEVNESLDLEEGSGEDFDDSFGGEDDWDGDFNDSDDEIDEASPSPAPKESVARGSRGDIGIKGWDPKEPYMDALKAATPGDRYSVYLEQRKEFATAPSFYLDCADFFMNNDDKDLALRVLSNVAEMKLEDYRLFRVLGHRLMQLGFAELAVSMFEQVKELRGEEPQSFRDLAHAYAAVGRYQEAVDMLRTIVEQPWDSRFPEIELIALEEMNVLIQQSPKKVKVDGLAPELLEALPLDIRVVLNWDANNCDMDLWVTDPHGEKCYYSNRETDLGAWMSRDFTGGYGPEEFLIRRAKPGEYKVQVHFYSNTQQTISGATTVQVQLITNFGKPNQKIQEVTRRLKTTSEDLEIGTIDF